MTFLGLRFPAFCFFFIGFPILWIIWIGLYALSPGPQFSDDTVDVIIPVHSSVPAIEKILSTSKVISDDRRFSMLTLLSGAATKLRAGEYRFKTGRKPLEIIDRLKKGKVLYRPVTLPEGIEIEKIAETLQNEGWIDRSNFIGLAKDPELLMDMEIEGDTLEGYLFPDTYYFSRGQQDEEGIIRMMVARHFQVYDNLIKKTDSRGHNLTQHEIITLAAIIEKETALAEERPIIASVFLNRLEKGMRLQADPTVRYGNHGINGPLRKSELRRLTPYNTYMIDGLPAGPIANPGEAAIQAVMSPAKTDYLYFVSKNDGSHYFSRTLKEHNQAVARYRENN